MAAMSSRSDVLKSLLRSTARTAIDSVMSSKVGSNVQRLLTETSFSRVAIADAQLTAAVARVAHVAAATVSVGQDRVRVDVSFEDGKQLLMALRPDGMVFAPGGAKELAFTVEPEHAAAQGSSRDVIAAIAGEIARALWRPALTRAPRLPDHGAHVSHEGNRWIVDLRSVPEVRWALRQRLPALLIEAIRARGLELGDGRLVLTLAIEGMRT
jgi:hypothetical protein